MLRHHLIPEQSLVADSLMYHINFPALAIFLFLKQKDLPFSPHPPPRSPLSHIYHPTRRWGITGALSIYQNYSILLFHIYPWFPSVDALTVMVAVKANFRQKCPKNAHGYTEVWAIRFVTWQFLTCHFSQNGDMTWCNGPILATLTLIIILCFLKASMRKNYKSAEAHNYLHRKQIDKVLLMKRLYISKGTSGTQPECQSS